MLPKPSFLRSAAAIFAKDCLCESRSHFAISTLVAFAVTALSSIGMSVAGAPLSPGLLAALLWVILFFSAMAGMSRVFVQEQDAGTLTTLRVYALPQAVFWGKMAYNILLLAGLSLIVTPLFFVFFAVGSVRLLPFAVVIALGATGIAIISTITAALSAQARGPSSLFTILTFPLILPGFLCVISLTGAVLAGDAPNLSGIGFLCGYDVVAAIAGSILFDFLWE